ncbi:hypothetical protein GOBAR_AA21570 [Gossypium barbadense]|uniref:Arabidopsis retrotransposon Orf1 C-terminal domain-containing protein n=1 Tax=Gossypium barbadense TaxID=3634 RepID=A0A2P5X6Z9_GOSBA|nr:hypothetical protein GOBAR_AA21570 [Gossypium barbadense]
MSLKEAHELFSSNSRGPVHEDRILEIEELDEWRTHKLRTHDKPKLRQNELDTSPNQLKVGDKVLLDAVDPHIVTTTPNEEIPLTVLSIFPFISVEVSHPKFDTFKINNTRLKPYFQIDSRNKEYTMSSSQRKKSAVPVSKKRKGASSSSGPTIEIHHPFLQFPNGPQEELFQILLAQPLVAGRCIDWAAVEQVQLADAIRALLTTDPWELFFRIIEPTYLELTMELCSTFHLQIVMTNYDDPGTVQFCLGGLVRQLSVPEFGEALCLYMEEFKEENELHTLNRHIHFSPSKCWHTLALSTASYNPSRSKASVLPPSLRYLHAILAHTITGRRESTSVVNTHDVYFLWCMSQGHVIDLAYFIALTIQHQMERHRKGVISIGPYVTRLVRHFRLLNTAAQESSLTLIGQMSLQGILSMLSMRMMKRRRGTYPPQYRLAQSTEEEAYEDIPDDVPPQNEDQSTQPPPPSCPVHAAVSYDNISERLTRFEQQCFQRFDNIDTTLQQICQHLHIPSPVPPRELSSDKDV